MGKTRNKEKIEIKTKEKRETETEREVHIVAVVKPAKKSGLRIGIFFNVLMYVL